MTHPKLQELIRECEVHKGGELAEGLRKASGLFLSAVQEDEELLAKAANALPTLPPAGSAWLAVVIGAGVERGHPASLTGPAIVQHLRSWLPKLPVLPEAEDEDDSDDLPTVSPEQGAWLNAFPELCQSVVTHLARLPDERRALAMDDALIERLEELESFTVGATWVGDLLRRTSGSLVALHVESGKGVLARYENVGNCFHLFSLLQTAVGRRLPGGRDPEPAVAAACQDGAQGEVSDQAWWHYGNPHCSEPDMAWSIWGEATLDTIPVFDGHSVMLLWPAILESRSWDGGFFGPRLEALPASLTIESELSPDECRQWFDRLGLSRDQQGE